MSNYTINVNLHLTAPFSGVLSFPIQTFASDSKATVAEEAARSAFKQASKDKKQKLGKKTGAKNLAFAPQTTSVSAPQIPLNTSKSASTIGSQSKSVGLIAFPALTTAKGPVELNPSALFVAPKRGTKEELERQFKERSESLLKAKKHQIPLMKISAPLVGTVDRKSNLATRSFFGKDLKRKDFASSLGTKTARARGEKSIDTVTSSERSLKRAKSVDVCSNRLETAKEVNVGNEKHDADTLSQRSERENKPLSSSTPLFTGKKRPGKNIFSSLRKSSKSTSSKKSKRSTRSEPSLNNTVVDAPVNEKQQTQKNEQQLYLHQKYVTLNASVDNVPISARVALNIKSKKKDAKVDLKQLWMDGKLLFDMDSEESKKLSD